ncbi:Enoyl-CoA delta isomerase 1, peroxisomal [Sphaceloma murrayae]|uniref:Enoyl-CoA delta isomerase 1, peroxisomal n=1 Tax=Sphaceloma murrayae TaxID=2082308 RepID=A0A2K1QZ07_9PEZI|nr:Enoyl-CoA delta isomerase 1, peroxisomal [Sphaceloma murrayae]
MSSSGGTLFKVPIATGGQVEVTSPAAKVYLLTFSAPPDNRLKSDFCQALILALDIIEFKYPHGVVITTSGIQKFYSNGLDLVHANYTPGFFTESLYALWRRLLIYPMPTIALINGHAFAGALMLAMHHDYRIMNPHKGYLCLNEVELGVPLRPPMSSIFRQKTTPTTYRTLVLEGRRFKSLDALKDGIVDALGGLDETLKYIDELQLVKKADKGVYGELKREMYRESLHYLENQHEEDVRTLQVTLSQGKEDAARKQRVQVWASKAKL